MAKKENTELQAQSVGYMILADADFGSMMAEELDGLDVNFERIKIPAGGAIMFEVPGEDGEPDAVKEFSAVILWHHPLRMYYKEKYTGGNGPPDCGSFDGVTGTGDPGGDCKTCPLNQFDTGENGAKACKERRRVYVLREGEVFPLLLELPTGSLKEYTRYLKRLLSKAKKSNSVVTRFSLKKATNNGGVVYSQAQFTSDRALAPEERKLIEAMTEQVKSFSGNVSFEYDVADEPNIDVMVDEETGEVL